MLSSSMISGNPHLMCYFWVELGSSSILLAVAFGVE